MTVELRPFGPTSRKVAVIGQGTWMIESGSRARVIAALRKGLDLGMTHLDTAEMYGSGAAEEIVGEAIAGRRNEVFLVSKVLPDNASRSGTHKACEQSLARLRTDRLDCYLLHWRGSHPLEETIGAFDELQRAGKILSWGVSNFDVSDLEEARRIGGDDLTCNQVLYHLQERAIEHAVLPWCEKHGVAVVGYSPYGSRDFPSPNTPGGRVLAEVAEAYGATPRQVALAFLTRWPTLFVIPKASSPEHVEENARAGDVRLSEEDVGRLDRAFSRGARPRSLPMI
jgi:diketogulonate reductase-like aldo/keto reductase